MLTPWDQNLVCKHMQAHWRLFDDHCSCPLLACWSSVLLVWRNSSLLMFSQARSGRLLCWPSSGGSMTSLKSVRLQIMQRKPVKVGQWASMGQTSMLHLTSLDTSGYVKGHYRVVSLFAGFFMMFDQQLEAQLQTWWLSEKVFAISSCFLL